METPITKKQLREFGMIIGIFCPIIFGLILPLIFGHAPKIWIFYISTTILILAIIKPRILLLPYKYWMKLGHILGWINSRIVLGLVFLLVLQPLALIMKICGHDPLRLKKDGRKSYKENKKNSNVDLTRIF